MSTSPKQIKTQWLNDIVASAETQESFVQAKPLELNKENESKGESNAFYTSLLKPKKMEEEDEKETEFVTSICNTSEGICVPVDMGSAKAQAYCDAANALYNSKDPQDRARAAKAWNLLKNGKENEALNILGIDAHKQEQKGGIELKPMPDTATKASTLDLGHYATKARKFRPDKPTVPDEENKENEAGNSSYRY
ncbi:hypothetical protein [uncultured Legionella sp.]|uniref:hypothetical protein n=1 Tax=uncultured Legionella sp. TaxID=210934 RepID=UPI00262AF85B|nr:hypothetical protein [uncultured Legionella sp.]